MADLTVLAVPGFFASMAAEKRHLDRKAEVDGPTAATYTREDALASLAMGTGSLFIPLLVNRALRPVVPGRGRYGRYLVGAAVGAAALTTAADVVARRARGPLPEPGVVPGVVPDVDQTPTHPDGAAGDGPGRSRRRRIARAARRVASSSGVAAVAAGVTAGALTWTSQTAAKHLFGRHDRDLGSGVLPTVAAIFAWDFIYYWNHRFSHESRWLWAMHVVHHSSEHYNLSTALRQPVADPIAPGISYGLLALLGFRPSVIETARGVNLLYQYWIHTEVIDELGRFERVLNTPSHHRVHHGSNSRYLDRNHGSILIIWDRLFGTFQPELDEEPVVYGLTRNIHTYNPARIATHEYADIARDVASSTTWSDRLSFAFRGPGWAYERRAAEAGLPTEVPDADTSAPADHDLEGDQGDEVRVAVPGERAGVA